ncbi:T9SS-dependent choice-of-anchor J family protein [Mongoliibacter ruber]|uniref:Putative secreted protein (Por secretion system target) n=1 Tax=Mongoliibacter ruber TaxID=1750599 RepID=A0A2T0WK95_9BACT|nr:choice-of-anchor J domain-containing protein [Mongoliibacter ruber]PRY87131.1 putative secreted protein (Por secretion system target) [Mongoliibacter ruber]
MKQTLPKMVLLFQLLMLLFVQVNAQTEVIAGWTFDAIEVSEREFADLGNANNTGENAQIINPVNINFTTYVQGTGGSGTFAKNSNGWQDAATTEKYWQVKVNTLDFENLSVSSKQQSSNTGPKEFRIDYSLDGTNWTTIPESSFDVANNFVTGTVASLAIPAAASNQAELFIRWIATSNVSVNGGIIAFGGTNRIDDILIEGTPIGEVVPEPEPTTLGLWDFSGEPGDQASTEGEGSINITALDFIRGSDINPTNALNSISGSNWSIGENAYFEFGLTVDEGFEAKMAELLIATRSSNTGPGDLALRYSLDNFESDLITWSNSGITFSNLRLDLSELPALTGSVRFRILVISNISANGGTLASGGTLRVANLFEEGVSIPVQFTGSLAESEVIPPAEPEKFIEWNFAGEPGNQEATEGLSLSDGVLAKNFERGPGLIANAGANSINTRAWNAAEGAYLSFGFDISPDKLVDLSKLQIGSSASNGGPSAMALRYSGDDFGSDLATWDNTTTFLNQEIDLSQLSNLSGEVEFRIVSTSNTAVNGNTLGAAGTFRITNFFPGNSPVNFFGVVKDAEGVLIPTVTIEPTTLDFGLFRIDEIPSILQYQLNAAKLVGDVVVSTTAPFGLSLDGENFVESLVLTPSQLEAAVSIFVQFASDDAGVFQTVISHTTEGRQPVQLNVSATAFDPFNISENFNEACSQGLPTGWSAISVLGDQEWACTTFGRAGTTPTASAPFGLQINGFAAGSARLNEDWLITPAYDLTGFNIPLLSFYSRVAFNGPRLKLLISTDYVEGDPDSGNWTELEDRFANGDQWSFSGELDLSAYLDQSIRLAFVYSSSTEEGAARWTLDDFELRSSDQPAAPFFSNSIGNIDYFHFGIVPAGTVSTETRTFSFTLSNPVAPLTIDNGAVGGFEFSKDGVTFSPNLSYSIEELAGTKTVTVRFAPSSEGAFSGPITFESGDINVKRGYLSGATLAKEKTFDVVNWNIEWFGSAGNGPSNLDLQLQNVKTLIEDLDADVYAFQEITGSQKLDELIEALEDYEGIVSPAVSLGPDNFETAQKLVFLYKKSTVEPIKTRVLLEGVQASDLLDYPSPPDRFWASGRLPFLLEVKTNIDGVQQKFNLVNIHARSNGGGESAGNPRYAMRRYDVNVLKDSLDAYYPDVPLIILGDYNDDLDETVADQTAPTVNTSETSFINYINDPENYTPVTISLSNAGLRSFPSFENVIDHVIISNELNDNWLVNSERLVVPFDLIPNYLNTTSDHLAVKTRFTVSCDIDLPLIIGENELCFESGSTELQLLGGNFTGVLFWETSTDGQAWDLVEGSEGLNSLEINELSSNRQFRAVVETNLCISTTESFEVVVRELPEPFILFERGKLATIEGPYTFTWYKNEQVIQSGSDNTVRIAGAGDYRVEIQDELGCLRSSDTIKFPIRPTRVNVRIFPNPANRLVNISLRSAEGLHNVELRSAFGALIASELSADGFVQFDVTNLSKGMYLIVITDQSGQRQIERLVIK